MIWGYHHLRKPPYKSEFVLLILFFSSSRGFHRFCTPQSNRFLHPVYLGGDKFWYIAGGEGEEAFITRKDWNAETVNIQSLAILDDWFDGKPNFNTAQATKVWSLVMFLKKTWSSFWMLQYWILFVGRRVTFVVGIRVISAIQWLAFTAGVYWLLTKELGSPDMFRLHHLDGLLLIFDDCWFFDSPGCVDKWQSNCWIRMN